jgi:predicted amidohydrolase YtcJ
MTRFDVVAARIRTMDPAQPLAEAMAVRDDRVLAVGTVAEVLAQCPPGTPVETLDATITPGLIDTHLHLQRGGLKIIHDLGDGPHQLDTVIAHLRDHGFEAIWGDEPPTLAERAAAMRLIQPLMHQLGITGVIDPAATRDELSGYQESWQRNELTMRVVAMPYPDVEDVDAAIQHLEGVGLTTGFGDERLRVGAIKVYFDGEGMKGEALLAQPWPHGSRGWQRIPTTEFQRIADHCARTGWSLGAHAVGGAAIDEVLACYARANEVASIAGRQWQVIHGYLETSPEAMKLAAELDVVLAAQPSITLRNGGLLLGKLGERAVRMNPLRSWRDAGVRVVLGSDGPSFPFDPRELMWSAVTRRVRGLDDPVGEEEAITAEEALSAYTSDAAIAAFAGDRRGILAAGRLADWTAFDRDPVTIDPEELRELRVLRTVVGGDVVYREQP